MKYTDRHDQIAEVCKTALTFILLLATKVSAADLELYIYAGPDPESKWVRESLEAPLSRFKAFPEYAAELKNLRQELGTWHLLEPSYFETPCYTFHKSLEPVPLKRMETHTWQIMHLLYLKCLHEHDLELKHQRWKSSSDANYWLDSEWRRSVFYDAGAKISISIRHRKPLVKPFPPLDVQYGWKRTMTVHFGDDSYHKTAVTYDGDSDLEVLKALDMGTRLVVPAIEELEEMEKRKRLSSWGILK